MRKKPHQQNDNPHLPDSTRHGRERKLRNLLQHMLLLGVLVLSVSALAGESAPETQETSATTPIWPMPARTDFSSGFGDYRPGRFHYGLDLRTGDNRLAVVAPVDGHVSQIWVQYFGYGRALYFAGDDGRTYVFAHLDHYAPAIDKAVRAIQVQKERYFVREWFDPERFQLNQGDTLAFSGKTGIGAPHMHFEIRDRENVPQSPLRQGLHIADNTGPQIKALTFRYLDHQTLFATGARTKTLAADFVGKDAEGASHYNLNAFPYLSAPFGLVVSAHDYPTNSKFDASPRELRYRVGKSAIADTLADHAGANADIILYQTLFRRTLDSLSYSDGALALDVYDQSRALQGDKNSYLLYQRHVNRLTESETDSSADFRQGLFPVNPTQPDKELYGVYPARIDVTDASGNRSTLDYSFCYGPPGDFFTVTDINAGSALLTTQRRKLLKKRLLFGELLVYELKDNGGWRIAENATVKRAGKGAFRVSIAEHARNHKRIFRAVLKGHDGWYKPDVIFSNIPAPTKTKVTLGYQLADGGLYVTAKTNSVTTEAPELQALSSDGATEELAVRQTGAKTFRAFLPFSLSQQPIVALRAYLPANATQPIAEINGLHIGAPAQMTHTRKRINRIDRIERKYEIIGNGVCSAPLVDSNFSKLLEWRPFSKHVPDKDALLAGPFYIGPEDVRYDTPVAVRMRADTSLNPALNIAICKLSRKGDKWDWYTTNYDEESFAAPFSAEITSNGVFALMMDTIGPAITKIHPAQGKTITSAMPVITAHISDNLSGIWVDTLFDIRLDGQWLIPEYDNEDNELKTRPNQPLKRGEHRLVISVRDNAGNRTQRMTTFRVQ